MFFSKSFGYACRGILYVALTADQQKKTQVDEIARKLNIPKHFLSKIMKNLVKNGILSSTKGPYGGFSLNNKTLLTPLSDIVNMTDGDHQFDNCILRLRACNADKPCPMHYRVETCRNDLHHIFMRTTIGDLLNAKQPDFIRSLATI